MVTIHPYLEHYNGPITGGHLFPVQRTCFRNNRGEKSICLEVYKDDQEVKLSLSYYIGLDWIDERNAIYVEPKVSSEFGKTDFLGMLYSCLKHSDVLSETENLYEIHLDKPYIEIAEKRDMLTPLIIVQFLQVVSVIVKKGLKRSYYPVEENLNAKVKGKILPSKNLRINTFKNRPLRTVCSFNEFGVNSLENKILKKALFFVSRYVAVHPGLREVVNSRLNYSLPAFNSVSDRVETSEMKFSHVNSLYKEYSEGIRLSKLILQRFGYNINGIESTGKVKLPPFWIDMSKLFELYVLGKLKDRFGTQIKYQFTRRWNQLDYLLNSASYKMIIDAKYKLKYDHTYGMEDIRQVSGYARLTEVSKELEKGTDEVIDCLIIYPDQNSAIELAEDLRATPIRGFNHIYKASIKLPIVIE